MRYRVDLTLNAYKNINVFRQTLTNNSDVAITISLTNITRNELIRNVNFLIENSHRLISEGVMPEGANGIVDFKVYDNPKRVGGRRNITFTNSINKDDYVCKFIDSSESNPEETCFLDTKYDVSMYLRYAGNPDVILAQGIESNFEDNSVEEVTIESEEAVIEEAPKVEEIVTADVEEAVIESEEAVTESEEAVIESEEVEIESKTYSKGEDGKFYCPFEDCEKHKEGYATEKGIKSHMLKVHNIEC